MNKANYYKAFLISQGNLLKVKVQHIAPTQQIVALRGNVSGFSAQSRKRMIDLLVRINFEKAGLTLTYPDRNGPPDYKIYERDRQTFQKRMKRKFPDCSAIWRREYESRKTGEFTGDIFPHYHYMFFGLPFFDHEELNLLWQEVIDYYQYVRTEIKGLANHRQAMFYLTKYMSKPEIFSGSAASRPVRDASDGREADAPKGGAAACSLVNGTYLTADETNGDKMTVQNQYVALARVSSREQEREGFSLDVQEDALHRYAQRNHGKIIKFYRIAETASKHTERKTFKELLAYCKKNAHKLDGVLFYKVDRAARNLFDYVELERLEVEHHVPVVYVAQPTENTPAGRMQRRILANMASFYTEQQSLDVKEGHQRRVDSGLFPCKAPFGYKNIRIDGRSLVEVDDDAAQKVRRIYELYSRSGETLDGVSRKLKAQGIYYSSTQIEFTRSKIHKILRDRSYIGEIFYNGSWYEGKQQPIVDRALFERVQVALGVKTYQGHETVYGSGMVKCAHCGRPVVAEVKIKKTKSGNKEYRYYRCSQYNKGDHPKIRISESKLDKQIIELFRQIKIDDPKIHDWIVKIIQLKTESMQSESEKQLDDIIQQHKLIARQRDRLLNMRIEGEIDREIFATKDQELRDKQAHFRMLIDSRDRNKSEYTEIVLKTFELSQELENKWENADVAEKRQILCLNYSLSDVNLVMTIRKLFDILIKQLSA